MALAIDASTPVFVAATAAAVSTLTTASFTPPVGALLVVVYANGGQGAAANQPSNTGGAVSWNASAKVSEVANNAAASVWFGTVTSSASMTVTQTLGASDIDWGFGVVVVTGQGATQNGATQVATSVSGTPSGTIASLVGSNSLILGGVGNFSNSTVGTAGSGQSLTFNGHAFSLSDGANQSAGWAQYLTGMNLAAGASATINDTAPTGIDYSLAMAEILAATGGGGGSTPAPHVPRLMTMGVGS